MPFPNKATQFKKGQVANPKGRPPKLVGAINRELIRLGFAPVSRKEANEVSLMMLNVPSEKLMDMVGEKGEKKGVPILFRIVAQRLISDQGYTAMESIMDRAYGKPKQEIEINSFMEVVMRVRDKINQRATELRSKKSGSKK